MWHDVKCEGQERATEMENEKQKLPNNLIRKFGQLQLAPFTLTEEGGKGEEPQGEQEHQRCHSTDITHILWLKIKQKPIKIKRGSAICAPPFFMHGFFNFHAVKVERQ